MKNREAVILLGYLEDIVDGGKTSRRITEETMDMGYMEPPMTRKEINAVKMCLYRLRKFEGGVMIINHFREELVFCNHFGTARYPIGMVQVLDGVHLTLALVITAPTPAVNLVFIGLYSSLFYITS
ncbi:hypothetical protein AKJ52_02740 [candidate division MSBL1 archaeon SCGC-AAA382C18]|uniref:Uncharacterized protein n=1 Tax=candidate division MSBL1 archaeon SCGC-AAA382C18 TaxID=1698281 RepID=A0A133VHM4_9EURY|nr:hypothetical protein AKJ52_02740 [candidate division MSBL1 archaeon SCGC-AAA382C18]